MDIAVLITTFLRDDVMMRYIPSYLIYPIKLYLLDQGYKTPEKEAFYAILRQQGHCIEYSEFDIGLSAARNRLIEMSSEPYLLLTEDDIELLTNPNEILPLFSEPSIGVIGGQSVKQPGNKIEKYEYELELNNSVLYYKKSDKLDIIDNFFVARREIFNEKKYDEQLKLCEHTDFFLQLKQLNKWKIIKSNNLQGNHHPSTNQKYSQYRHRVEFNKIFFTKWNIKDIKEI